MRGSKNIVGGGVWGEHVVNFAGSAKVGVRE